MSEKAYALWILFSSGEELVIQPSDRTEIISKSSLQEMVEKLMKRDSYHYVMLWDCYINPNEVAFVEILKEGDLWSFPSQ